MVPVGSISSSISDFGVSFSRVSSLCISFYSFDPDFLTVATAVANSMRPYLHSEDVEVQVVETLYSEDSFYSPRSEQTLIIPISEKKLDPKEERLILRCAQHSCQCPFSRCDFPETIRLLCSPISATVRFRAGGNSGGFTGDTAFEAHLIQKVPVLLNPEEAMGHKVILGQGKLACEDKCVKMERQRKLSDASKVPLLHLEAVLWRPFLHSEDDVVDLCDTLTDKEVEVVERLYCQAMRLEMDFLYSRHAEQSLIIPLYRKLDPKEERLMLFTDFDFTCTRVASLETLANIEILIAKKPDHQLLDEDRDFGKTWELLFQQYASENESFIEKILLAVSFDYEGLYSAFAKLSSPKGQAVSRIFDSVVVKGILLEYIKQAGKCNFNVMSCRSADPTKSALSGGLDMWQVDGNEFSYADGIFTGEATCQAHQFVTAKIIKYLEDMVQEYASEHGVGTSTVSIGDSVSDLLCLLTADIGIVIGPNKSLMKVGNNHFGILECWNRHVELLEHCNDETWSRPWWTPSPYCNHLLAYLNEGEGSGDPKTKWRHYLVKCKRDLNWCKIIERRSLLPRLIYGAILCASLPKKYAKATDTLSESDKLSQAAALSELFGLNERYTESLDLSFNAAVSSTIVETSSGQRSLEGIAMHIMILMSFGVFVGSWSLISHNLDALLTVKYMREKLRDKPQLLLVSSPEDGLPCLAWKRVVIHSCIRFTQGVVVSGWGITFF